MESQKIALVTGGNRGIGLGIVRGLTRAGIHTIMGVRELDKGRNALEMLNDQGLSGELLRLEVDKTDTHKAAIQEIIQKHGRIDILINNAAILLDNGTPGTDLDIGVFKQTLDTNVSGALSLCQTVIPVMRKQGYGRIINLSSGMGAISEMGSGYIAYRVSKTALNAITLILSKETAGQNIQINSMCPGWVATDMGGKSAPRSIEEGADTAVWLAQRPDGSATGKFFRDRKEIEW